MGPRSHFLNCWFNNWPADRCHLEKNIENFEFNSWHKNVFKLLRSMCEQQIGLSSNESQYVSIIVNYGY